MWLMLFYVICLLIVLVFFFISRHGEGETCPWHLHGLCANRRHIRWQVSTFRIVTTCRVGWVWNSFLTWAEEFYVRWKVDYG